MRERSSIVLGLILGAFTTGIYSWYTRSSISGEALANIPLVPAGQVTGASVSLAPRPLQAAPAASFPAAKTPGVEADSAAEAVTTAPSDRVTAAPERVESPVRNSGRGKSKRDASVMIDVALGVTRSGGDH